MRTQLSVQLHQQLNCTRMPARTHESKCRLGRKGTKLSKAHVSANISTQTSMHVAADSTCNNMEKHHSAQMQMTLSQSF
eukprot:5981213-Pleurochrysis_carterae.AAC.1